MSCTIADFILSSEIKKTHLSKVPVHKDKSHGQKHVSP